MLTTQDHDTTTQRHWPPSDIHPSWLMSIFTIGLGFLRAAFVAGVAAVRADLSVIVLLSTTDQGAFPMLRTVRLRYAFPADRYPILQNRTVLVLFYT